jgi:hypothetical protein
MNYSPLAVKRSNVLGNIYKQCDAIESIPVYLNDQSGEPLGLLMKIWDGMPMFLRFIYPKPFAKIFHRTITITLSTLIILKKQPKPS